jgi:hypothetical protein
LTGSTGTMGVWNTMIETNRRSFITGLVSFVAAPAIVRAANIMPVRVERLSKVEIINRALHSITVDLSELHEIQVDQIVFGTAAYRWLSVGPNEVKIERIDPREMIVDGWAGMRGR